MRKSESSDNRSEKKTSKTRSFKTLEQAWKRKEKRWHFKDVRHENRIWVQESNKTKKSPTDAWLFKLELNTSVRGQ